MSTLFRLVLTFWREYHLKKRIYSTRHTNWRHWCQKLHRDALDIAQQTKQQLIDFEVDDTEQEKCSKQQRKTQINDNLDKLEQYLKKISWNSILVTPSRFIIHNITPDISKWKVVTKWNIHRSLKNIFATNRRNSIANGNK
eukprot:422163_1